jgi:hypothetical protein
MLLALAGLSAGTSAFAADSASPPTGEPFRYNARGRRDPFVALVRDGRIVGTPVGRGESSRPVLYGVLWDPAGRSIALINDGEARVGDMVAGYRVIEIRKDAVVLANGGEPLVIEIAFDAPKAAAPGAATGGGQP